MTAKLIQVIEVQTNRGRGTDDDPVRTIHQSWSPEGKLLAEDDPQTVGAMPRSQAAALAEALRLFVESCPEAGSAALMHAYEEARAALAGNPETP